MRDEHLNIMYLLMIFSGICYRNMSHNTLQGSIPGSMGNLSSLVTLYVTKELVILDLNYWKIKSMKCSNDV